DSVPPRAPQEHLPQAWSRVFCPMHRDLPSKRMGSCSELRAVIRGSVARGRALAETGRWPTRTRDDGPQVWEDLVCDRPGRPVGRVRRTHRAATSVAPTPSGASARVFEPGSATVPPRAGGGFCGGFTIEMFAPAVEGPSAMGSPAITPVVGG